MTGQAKTSKHGHTSALQHMKRDKLKDRITELENEVDELRSKINKILKDMKAIYDD